MKFGSACTGTTGMEDFGHLHMTFEGGTVADILASDVVLGGVANWIEAFSGNHRTRCNLGPIDALESFVPGSETMRDGYVVEKIHPKQGWIRPAPDEDWQRGCHADMETCAELLSAKRFCGMALSLRTNFCLAPSGDRCIIAPATGTFGQTANWPCVERRRRE